MSNNASFLPDDYLDQRAERRTNVISLVLFVIVMLGVFLAFLFTNQRWTMVKSDQDKINARYQQAAEQIKELVELEEQKTEMLQKAELAAALVERVPRSVLLAELINRMPERLSLMKVQLSSEKLKPIARKDDDKRGGGGERLKGPRRARTREQAAKDVKKIRAPRYQVAIALTGVAPTGQEVSRYLAELNNYALLDNVTLQYTEEKEVEGLIMQQFKIEMSLDPAADVRDTDPLIVPRSLANTMTDKMPIRASRVIGPAHTSNVDSSKGQRGD